MFSVTVRCVLKFYVYWYRPTRVVLEKGPSNGCVCVCDNSNVLGLFGSPMLLIFEKKSVLEFDKIRLFQNQ